jgi:hypothetical protein
MRALLLLAALVSGVDGRAWWSGKSSSSDLYPVGSSESTSVAFNQTSSESTSVSVGQSESTSVQSSESNVYTPKTLYIDTFDASDKRTLTDDVDIIIEAMNMYGDVKPSEASEVTLTIEEKPSSDVYTLRIIH